MGITDFFTDVWETFANPAADADQPPVQGGSSTQSPASGTDEESSEEAEVNKQDAAKGDPKETLEKECAESKECHGPKHHYDECAQRVTGQIENDGKAKEDCVEEFFHLAHCASQCAAPKLFAQLK
ncbi:ubiquinol-cytochrome c reductase complex 17 kd protein [Pyrenophora tritici-repentis]|nr:ubiquinol-cytochrome c reductase complex subunit [Pyrenophora tritici-repentis]KAI1524644.1 ubiquinol-cytochrome c reductase complex 17 kd protein [Pyrenophora tritici-repentis]KAI1537593.1 ubiquinol-cytochrome c reductase complex 17 kd protein [Pyrenophora tritici-repentis]KAI1552122.1 ubiquinol-cytochrome c reductase complex 17 kd protein [Pyrenophora tritici-repentis]KAI1560721.1 ubiquinol-cytochrome c reductase complex 17 kd protein [Pyrenophora tritici-repentis]